MAYTSELHLALRAVHRASLLTKSVLRSLQNNVSAETKADSSPVTIADFAAQALLISALHSAYPGDAFLGEESADALRENGELADAVWELVVRAKEFDVGEEGGKLAFPKNKEDMFTLIDLGGKGEETAKGRVWVMDPVDGTATFMQGQQYAVCLCLMVEGVQQVGVVGCPNLSVDVENLLTGGGMSIHEDAVDKEGCGVVLSAVKGQGTFIRSMKKEGLGQEKHVDLTRRAEKELKELNFVEATIGKTSLSQDEHKDVATALGATWPGTILWSQQMKYVALTLGAADVMVRIPKTKDRFTCVWDHAGGHLLFQEAGGVISDFNGEQIDFTQGRLIKGERNYGMIACMPGLFEQVGRAVMEVLGRRAKNE